LQITGTVRKNLSVSAFQHRLREIIRRTGACNSSGDFNGRHGNISIQKEATVHAKAVADQPAQRSAVSSMQGLCALATHIFVIKQGVEFLRKVNASILINDGDALNALRD
jgi:hypothetical protein